MIRVSALFFVILILLLGCSSDARFSGQVQGKDRQPLTGVDNGNNGNDNGNTGGTDGTRTTTQPSTPQTPPPPVEVGGGLTIVSATSAFDDQNDMVTVAIKVLDTQKNPASDVAVVFTLAIDSGEQQKTISFTKVITNSSGIAEATQSITSGISADTIRAWKLSAQLNDLAATTVIAGDNLEFGTIYNYSWQNSGTCSTNVLRIKVDDKNGNPMPLPASINEGDDIKVLVLPTASSAACNNGYYKLVKGQHQQRQRFIGNTHPDTVNTLCELGAKCWLVTGNSFTQWHSATNRAALGQQQWVMRGSATWEYSLFVTQ
ncbi:MAG: hypothetical protein OYH77_07105 [Pseudomonadota bacterium]|nr:hypothetical protein [Pseudomonadota bacterium]